MKGKKKNNHKSVFGLSLLLTLFSTVVLSISNANGIAINWSPTFATVGKNAGWGRLFTPFQTNQSLITWTEYDNPLPQCAASWPHPGPQVWVASSSNNFQTYDTISWIASPPGFIQEQSFLLQLTNPPTRILLVMRNRLPNCNWFGLPVVYSDDNARTWHFISQLDQTTHPTGVFNRGLWEPFLYNLPNGCVAGFYADETFADEGYNQIVAQRVSCDAGKSWGPRIFAVAVKDRVSRPGMPGVARLSNGHTILVYEVCGPDRCNVHYKTSVDGVHWPAGLGTIIPDQNAGPYVTVTDNGRVVVTSACTNMISISENNGATWVQNPQRAWNAGCYTWPAVYGFGGKQVGVAVSGLSPAIQIRFGNFTA